MVETTRTLLDFKKYGRKIKLKGIQRVLHSSFSKYSAAAMKISNFPLDENIIKMEFQALLSHLEKYQKVGKFNISGSFFPVGTDNFFGGITVPILCPH